MSLTPFCRVSTLMDLMETHFRPYAAEFTLHLSVLSFALNHGGQTLDQDTETRIRNIIQTACAKLQELSKLLGLRVSADLCGTAILRAGHSPVYSASLDHAFASARAAMDSLRVELESIQFLPISFSAQQYLNGDFGPAVSKAFPECIDDIREAHLCFAFGRYTACMFHLGRVMEMATKALGRKLRISAPKRDELQRWLTEINDKISKMPFKSPAQKKKREPLVEAAAHLFNFKETWRNKTMHPERSYTEEQAAHIMKSTHGFLDVVAVKIFKVKV